MKYLEPFVRFNEAKSAKIGSIEEIEDYFLELIDSEDVDVKVTNHIVNKQGKRWIKGSSVYGYKITISLPLQFRESYNIPLQNFVRGIVKKAVLRLSRGYNIHYNQESKMGWKITITISPKNLNESNQEDSIEEIEDHFIELIDKNINIEVNSSRLYNNKNLSIAQKIDTIKKGFLITIVYEYNRDLFVDKIVNKAIERLKRDYNIVSNYKRRVHALLYNFDEEDNVVAWEINISPKNLNESVEEDSNLLIVDVQKSFHKFFTENYINQLKEYAKKYSNVYQIWDNHIEGKNVDNDYLYDKKPDTPSIHNDLYAFANQKMLIEKRYTYDVDAKFFKKILDEKTYQIVKDKEKKKLLKRGEIFKTNEGTIIVYIGNNHVWFHCPKKLYELLLKLKGKHLTVVGGSDSECLSDVFTTCESLGVLVKRDWGYIYSATNCPIQ